MLLHCTARQSNPRASFLSCYFALFCHLWPSSPSSSSMVHLLPTYHSTSTSTLLIRSFDAGLTLQATCQPVRICHFYMLWHPILPALSTSTILFLVHLLLYPVLNIPPRALAPSLSFPPCLIWWPISRPILLPILRSYSTLPT